jgi:uncharacterized protein
MYETWVDFHPTPAWAKMILRVALGLLSVTFITASLLSFRSSNLLVRILYRAAALWIGMANFLFVAASMAWLLDLCMRIGLSGPGRMAVRPYVADALLIAAVTTAVYGIANARRLRVRKVEVTLPGLPQSWRGRKALLISDMHLGHVNGAGFARRVATKAQELDPAAIFLAGDLFDGSKVDAGEIIAPLKQMQPPLGVFFVDGNHEEFGGAAHFEDAVRKTGIRVLHNECVTVDGVRIAGVAYGPTAYPLQMRAFLEQLELKGGPASILLSHVPNKLSIAEHAGVKLQLSGHTHGGGQIFPYNFITRRAFGKFTYGLQRFGEMQVYTSSGVGTWGPPMRVGTHSEIVLLTFA